MRKSSDCYTLKLFIKGLYEAILILDDNYLPARNYLRPIPKAIGMISTNMNTVDFLMAVEISGILIRLPVL